MRRSARGNDDRGFVLITTFMVIALFMVYGSSLTLRTLTQQRVEDQLRSRTQAVDLAQGAVEQLRAELYQFLLNSVQMPVGVGACSGDAVCAFAWLDSLGASISGGGTAPSPAFVNGVPGHPRLLAGLPTVQAGSPPSAWIVKIVSEKPSDPLAARDVTIRGQATVDGVTRMVQATYAVQLGMAAIFRYAYFLNNYGYIENTSGGDSTVNGEIRSNGDLTIAGGVHVNGDLYASKNPTLGMDGDIYGHPWGWLPSWYWIWHDPLSRPARQLSLFGAPPAQTLPLGLGYDITLNAGLANPNNQHVTLRRFEHQPIQPIPYLGDLIGSTSPYKARAVTYDGGAHPTGGYLRWTDPGPDGYYEWWGQGGDPGDPPTDDVYNPAPITGGIYKGPDGILGTADDATPLVVIGSPRHPIEIDGPVIVPGDVIIRGQITGRGTIYSGRNIHVVDGLAYKNKPAWPILERNTKTGQIRERCVSESLKRESNLGTVCNDGTFYQKGVSPPAGCIP